MLERLPSTLPVLRAVLICTLLAPALAAQSAWTQPEGGTFVQLSFNAITPYDQLYSDGGTSFVTGREMTETSLELYGEYGLFANTTLVGNLPLRNVDSGALVPGSTIQPVTIPEDSLSDLGNLLLGVRRQLSTGSLSITGEFDVEFPTGTSDDSTGLSTGLDAYTFRPLVSVGQGFGKTYLQGYAGLSFRTDDYSDDWRLGGELGYQFTPRFLLAGTLDLVDSFENGSVQFSSERLQTGLFLDNQEYASFGLKGLWSFSEHFGLSAAVRGAFWGNNVPEAPFLSFGVYYQR